MSQSMSFSSNLLFFGVLNCSPVSSSARLRFCPVSCDEDDDDEDDDDEDDEEGGTSCSVMVARDAREIRERNDALVGW